MSRLLTVAVLALTLNACSVESSKTVEATPEPSVSTQTVAVGPHTVQCGCSVEGVGECGNYILIDGSFVAIANSAELGLGPMEWCGQGPVQAEAAGTVAADGFTGTLLKVTP